MNYEFHVGDYVETKAGQIGYISKICTCKKCNDRGWYEPSIKWTVGNLEDDYISNYEVDAIPDIYVRIGAYDFTKKEKKIEPITQSCSNDKTIDKINELIGTVNKLLDKLNK